MSDRTRDSSSCSVSRDGSSLQPQDGPLGLIAGWGRYPLVLATALRERGYRVVCTGVRHHADPALNDVCHAYREFGLGRLGAGIRFFRRHGVTHVTMAGKIHKVLLFRPWYWWHHFPDWMCLKTFFPHFITNTLDRKDDTLLMAVVSAFARHGLTMIPATDLLPEVLVHSGVLSRRHPTRREAKDIAFGWHIAKEMGRMDIGQSVVVKGQAVLSVEAIEGTDECIRRAGMLCPAGGFTVVKVAKPQQDMRFDVPTIGLGTLQAMHAAGGKCLAVEAERTIVVDQQRVLDFAARHGIAIVAVHDNEVAEFTRAA